MSPLKPGFFEDKGCPLILRAASPGDSALRALQASGDFFVAGRFGAGFDPLSPSSSATPRI